MVNALDNVVSILISNYTPQDGITPVISKIYEKPKDVEPRHGQDFIFVYSEEITREAVDIGSCGAFAKITESIIIDLFSRPVVFLQSDLTSDVHAIKAKEEIERIIYSNFTSPGTGFVVLDSNTQSTDLSTSLRGVFRYKTTVRLINYFKNMAPTQGEANTASNVGAGGVGPFKQKTGVDLEFKNINAGSNKVTVTDDTVNSEIDIDIDPSQIVIGDLGDVSVSSPSDGQALVFNSTGSVWEAGTIAGITVHSDLAGLSADDHTQYALLAGRSGGQTLVGGSDSGDDLTFSTTSNASKGSYIFSEMTSAGFLKNDVSGVVTGGNSVDISDDTNLAATAPITLTGDTLSLGIKNSLEIDSNDLQLVNDASSPGLDQYYGTDATGTKGYFPLPASGGTPGGADTNVQFNDSGSFGGDSGFIWNNTSKHLGIGPTTVDEKVHISEAADGDVISLLLENSQAASSSSTNETTQLRFGFGGNNDVARITAGKISDYTTTANEDSFLAVSTDRDGTSTEVARFLDTGSFVVGSTQLDDTGSSSQDKRMWFDKVSGAFRAGEATGNQWDSSSVGDESAAFGSNCRASGEQSLALGNGCTASGNQSFAGGNGSTSDERRAFAWGFGCLSSGAGSVALGGSDALGDISFACGQNSVATGRQSVAIGGQECVVASTNGIGIGSFIDLSGSSVAVGFNLEITNFSNYCFFAGDTIDGQAVQESVVVGFDLVCSKTSATNITNAHMFGSFLESQQDDTVTIGSGVDTSNKLLNDTSGLMIFGLNSTIPTFVISEGSGAGTLGKVGIGTGNATPTELLDISTGTKCDGLKIKAVAEAQTTDATQTTLDSITLEDENTYHVEATVIGVQSDGSNRASYNINATVYRTSAGSATLQGTVTNLHSQESNSSWDATFTVSGNDVRVSVTGVAATTIEWTCMLKYMNLSN